MFNVGGGEFLVIALVALIVLGPQRLPDAARQVGKAMGELRRLSSGFQEELRGALEDSTEEPPRVASRPAGEPSSDVPAVHPEIDAAVTSVSEQPPARRVRRREPLRAAPIEHAATQEGSERAQPRSSSDGS